MSGSRRNVIKVLAPLVLLALSGLLAWYVLSSASRAETQIPEPLRPLVRTMTVQPETVRLDVHSQGTVSPRTESQLVAEVAGRLTWVAPQFVAGGFFDEAVPLLRIDSHDYQQAVHETEARIARAELRLAQQEAEAEIAGREWDALGSSDEAAPLTLRLPQVAEARANLEAAHAAEARAQRDLMRTAIVTPYAGRIRSTHVDIGQFVNRGTTVATVYAVDYAEVRLPLPNAELAYVDLPLDYRGDGDRERGPQVQLTTEFAGRRYVYEGRIVRTEGEIDPRSRMVTAVAQVADPYARGADPLRPPLAAGMFVEAAIVGREFDDVLRVPRSALRQDGRVLLVDNESRLRFRQVEILRTTATDLFITKGLNPGDRVCLSPLSAVTDGMFVRTDRKHGPS